MKAFSSFPYNFKLSFMFHFYSFNFFLLKHKLFMTDLFQSVNVLKIEGLSIFLKASNITCNYLMVMGIKKQFRVNSFFPLMYGSLMSEDMTFWKLILYIYTYINVYVYIYIIILLCKYFL